MIYCESKDMVEKIKNAGIENVQRKNNFRDVIKISLEDYENDSIANVENNK